MLLTMPINIQEVCPSSKIWRLSPKISPNISGMLLAMQSSSLQWSRKDPQELQSHQYSTTNQILRRIYVDLQQSLKLSWALMVNRNLALFIAYSNLDNRSHQLNLCRKHSELCLYSNFGRMGCTLCSSQQK